MIYIVLTDTDERFQSTSPVRGTTSLSTDSVFGYQISIHVPREGDDRNAGAAFAADGNFNPRPP